MKKIQIHKVIFTVFLFAIGFTMLTPLLWMISTSFKPENEVFQFPIKWIPEHSVGLANYKEVWGSAYNFGMYYLNSIKVTVISTVLQILVSALGAYGFTKIKWKGRDQLFLVYLATMMIPAQVMIVSRFVIMQKMNLYNTHMGIIMMTMFSLYGVFLLRQAMMAIPVRSVNRQNRWCWSLENIFSNYIPVGKALYCYISGIEIRMDVE